MDKIVHCLNCGAQASGKENFLCEECADPNKIILVCVCGARYELIPGSEAETAISTDVQLPLTPGDSIRASSCSACDVTVDGLVRFTIFKIKSMAN